LSDVDNGTGETVGTLNVYVGDAIKLTQVIEGIALLDNIDNPSVRRTARDRSLGGGGGKENDLSRE